MYALICRCHSRGLPGRTVKGKSSGIQHAVPALNWNGHEQALQEPPCGSGQPGFVRLLLRGCLLTVKQAVAQAYRSALQQPLSLSPAAQAAADF